MLNREEIRQLINERNLITDFINLDAQITPNGFDMTVEAVFEFSSQGALDFSNKERVIPERKEIVARKNKPQDTWGWWDLSRGVYLVKTNEVCNFPNDLSAIAFPRSSLLRMGAFVHNGVWDAGFKGKSEFILVIENPHGMRLKQNARVLQLVFMKMTETEKGYAGVYQNRV